MNQTKGPVTLPEMKFLTLNCTYQTTYTATDYLFWYVQYQSKEPVLLLKSLSDNQEVHNRGFQAKLVKTKKSFHLKRPSVQMSDSAVYFCALGDTVRESTGGAECKPQRAHAGLQGSSLAILGATGGFPRCSQETYKYLTGKWRLYFRKYKNTCYGKYVHYSRVQDMAFSVQLQCVSH